MNAIVQQNNLGDNVPMTAVGGGGMLQPRSLGDIVEFSRLMCKAGPAIPKHLRDNAGACMAVTMQALRWEMDPFAVANKSYYVNDRVAYEAQLIAAVVATRARLQKRMTYDFQGEGENLTCTVTGTFSDGITQSYTSPPIGKITNKNSPLWKTDPQQQIGYFSARSWARRYTPEVILGVYDREEIESLKQEPMRDVTPINPLLPPTDDADGVDAEPHSPAPFLERFADALALATTADEIQMVLDTYDSELLEQGDSAQEIARIAVNAKQRELEAKVA
jgi:hypothetical protein